MNVISQEIQSDASAWTAVVEVAGVLFRVGYVAGRLSCGLVPYKHNPPRPRWAEKYVREWAEKQIASLPESWHAAHRSLYFPELSCNQTLPA
jgi:hypothetical protein